MLKKMMSVPSKKVGKAGRLVITQIKLWSHCARLLRKNRAGQQAAALSYHTVFGIVPLVIVGLWLFQSIPAYNQVGDRIKNFIYDQANFSKFQSPAPDPDHPEKTIALTDYIDELVGGFFEGPYRRSIGGVSLLLVVWAALALLLTIERAFNNIWHVARLRGFMQRMINYWALITLGPLLIAVGIYVTTEYTTFGKLQTEVFGSVSPIILSYLVATAAFFLLYFVLPNTKVKAGAAIWGAAVAALVWITAKSLFGYCVAEWRLYNTLYGAMALFPITVLWIYITWLIVLFGLQLTFTTQYLKTLDAAEITAARKTEEHFIANDLTVVNIVRYIAAAFEANNAPVSAELICSKLDIPGEFGEKLLDHLVTCKLLVKSSEPRAGFMPAQDPENMRLSEIADAVAKAGFGQPDDLQQLTQSHRAAFDQYNLKQIINPEKHSAVDT